MIPQPIGFGPSLHLFTPDDDPDPGELSSLMTLSQFYKAYVLPQVLIHAAIGTRNLYATSVRYWQQFTGDPALADIAQATCGDFARGLATVKYRGELLDADTQHKHCRNIQMVLDRAGPIARRGRYGSLNVGLLNAAPVLLKPTLEGGDVDDVYTLDELRLWLEACCFAQAPVNSQIRTIDWWSSLGVVAYNTGLRIGALLKLRFDWMRRDELGWWVGVPAKALKQKRAQDVYLNSHALAAIERMRVDRERIFEWPHGQPWLHTIRRRLLAASGLPPPRRFGFRALRKAFATQCGMINPLAAKMALGHSTKDVTKDHYTHRSLMVSAMDKLPQPAWEPDQGKQLRLF